MLEPADKDVSAPGVEEIRRCSPDDASVLYQAGKVEAQDLITVLLKDAAPDRFPRAVAFHPDNGQLAIIKARE